MRHWSGHSWMVFYKWRWRLSSEIFLLSRLRVSRGTDACRIGQGRGQQCHTKMVGQKNAWSFLMDKASCKKNVFLLDLACHLVYPAAI